MAQSSPEGYKAQHRAEEEAEEDEAEEVEWQQLGEGEERRGGKGWPMVGQRRRARRVDGKDS